MRLNDERRTKFGTEVAEGKSDAERSCGALAICAGSLDCANETYVWDHWTAPRQ